MTGEELDQLPGELDLVPATPTAQARGVYAILDVVLRELGGALQQQEARLARNVLQAMRAWSSSPEPQYGRDLRDDLDEAISDAIDNANETVCLQICLRAIDAALPQASQHTAIRMWQRLTQSVAVGYAHAALDQGADVDQANEIGHDTAAALLEHGAKALHGVVDNPGTVVKSRVVRVDRYSDRGGSGSVATVTVSGFSRPVFVVFYSQVAKGHRAAVPRVFTLSDRGKPKSVSERVAKIALHTLSRSGATRRGQ